MNEFLKQNGAYEIIFSWVCFKHLMQFDDFQQQQNYDVSEMISDVISGEIWNTTACTSEATYMVQRDTFWTKDALM